jgi:hypothetical protein
MGCFLLTLVAAFLLVLLNPSIKRMMGDVR